MMKRLNPKFLLVTLLAIVCVACSSDDDNGPTNIDLTVSNLAGTYELTFFEDFYERTETASDGSTVTIETESCVGDTFTNALFTFNTDGTFVASGNYREVCELVINGQTSNDEEIVSLSASGSYSVNTDSDTIIIEGDVNDVTLFDGTNLRITNTDIDTEDGETETYTTEVRLVKQN